MTVVLDASALVLAIRPRSAPAGVLRRRLVDTTSHAPHLIDAETGNVLRRHVLAGDVAPSDARTLLDAAAALVDVRYYVALAQALDVPLLTADATLARASKLTCAVEVVGCA